MKLPIKNQIHGVPVNRMKNMRTCDPRKATPMTITNPQCSRKVSNPLLRLRCFIGLVSSYEQQNRRDIDLHGSALIRLFSLGNQVL